MTIVKTIEEVRAQVKAWRAQGLTVGLVPTMGYLHEGHQSLIARSVAENDRTVVSDFVNPIQFGPTEDLATYPRDIARDAALCEATGAEAVQCIGSKFVVYRQARDKDKRKIVLVK